MVITRGKKSFFSGDDMNFAETYKRLLARMNGKTG